MISRAGVNVLRQTANRSVIVPLRYYANDGTALRRYLLKGNAIPGIVTGDPDDPAISARTGLIFYEIGLTYVILILILDTAPRPRIQERLTYKPDLVRRGCISSASTFICTGSPDKESKLSLRRGETPRSEKRTKGKKGKRRNRGRKGKRVKHIECKRYETTCKSRTCQPVHCGSVA